MAISLIDTHCHLDREPLAGFMEEVLSRAQKAGVMRFVSVGTDIKSSRRVIELSSKDSRIMAAIGVHPHDTESASGDTLAELEKMADSPSVVAIGEIGLDFFREITSPELQRQVLHEILLLAARKRLPVLLHCRDAYDAMLEELKRANPLSWRGVLHCASGPASFVNEALALGLHVSFAGNVTFPKATALRELIKMVPDDRLLLETDAPFLAPQPVRGKPNEPAYLLHTAEYVARLRGMSLEALAALTTANAKRLFCF